MPVHPFAYCESNFPAFGFIVRVGIIANVRIGLLRAGIPSFRIEQGREPTGDAGPETAADRNRNGPADGSGSIAEYRIAGSVKIEVPRQISTYSLGILSGALL